MGLDISSTVTKLRHRYGSYSGVHGRRVVVVLCWCLAAQQAGAPEHVWRGPLNWLKDAPEGITEATPELLMAYARERDWVSGIIYGNIPSRADLADITHWPHGDYPDNAEDFMWTYPQELKPFDGAFHGLHLLINMSDCEGWHSPGEVRDIATMFQFIAWQEIDKKYPLLYSNIDDLADFFTQVALKGEGVDYH